ncbi:hypothetical protein D3C71_1901030 [compost metagenome]
MLKSGAKGKLVDSTSLTDIRRKGKEIVVVINDQIVKLPKHAKNASATQVASGAGKYSTSGTNSAIDSPGTKQQDAVGGNGKASNTLASKKRGKN